MIHYNCGYCYEPSEKFEYTPRSTSYPFSNRNPKYDLLRQIKLWYKKKPITVTNPPEWPGEDGKPVTIPENLKNESESRFKENQFNIVASELIALNRSISDMRPKE